MYIANILLLKGKSCQKSLLESVSYQLLGLGRGILVGAPLGLGNRLGSGLYLGGGGIGIDTLMIAPWPMPISYVTYVSFLVTIVTMPIVKCRYMT